VTTPGHYNPLLDGAQFHMSEVTDLGPAIIRGQLVDAVRVVSIDYEAAAARNLGYIRASIALRRAREEKENREAAGN
jgi:hypothetical protein